MRGNDVAAVGECMLELSGRARADWHMGFAGDTFNTLWAMRALLPGDVAADYVTAFGDDPFSRDQIAFFRDHGIGIASSPVIAGARPGLYAITLHGAERSFTYWRADAAARRLADDPAALRASLAGRRLAYFSGITLAILEPKARETLLDTLKEVRDGGTTVAFDPNYRPRLWPSPEAARAAIAAALGVADIALPTFPDEKSLFGDGSPAATAERLQKAGVGEIVVKDGEAPALVVASGTATSVPAVRVEAVDTTGAGDSFNGAYLAARLCGDDPVAAARRAHRVAAAVVQVRGALAPFATLKQAFG